MQKLWALAKKRLTTEEIKNEMFLRTDREGRNVWHNAAFKSDVDIMQRLWELGKGRLRTKEIKMECFYAHTMGKGTPGT